MVYDGKATVATAGTRVPLLPASTDHKIRLAFGLSVQNQKSGNTGACYVGGNTVSSSSGIEMVTPGDTYTFPTQNANVYDLSTIFVDAATNGNVVKFVYSVR